MIADIQIPNFSWGVLIQPACVLFGAWAALFVKDKARDAARSEFTEQITAALAVFKNQFRDAARSEFSDQITAALAVFKTQLLEGLSDRFVSRRECAACDQSRQGRMEELHKRVDFHQERLLQIERVVLIPRAPQ